jgi:HD-like signal output (HDOD) protein
MTSPRLSSEKLREFTSFRTLAEEDLLLLAGSIELRSARRGEVLFECGDIDARDFFLLNGRLQLVAEDGRERSLEAGSDAARMPVARLRPRQYTARAQTSVEYFMVDCDVLDALNRVQVEGEGIDYGYGVVEVADAADDEAAQMLHAFRRDLDAGRFRLTSLPEVALKIREQLADDSIDARRLAATISRDPAIATKLLRAANSPLYAGAGRCDTVQAAITRLGFTTTRQLVIGFTLRDLFTSSNPMLRCLMEEAWQQSLDVAAISWVLSRQLRLFNPEEAMLAGLVSNIGVLSVLTFAQSYPPLLQDEALLRQWVDQLRSDVGAMVLTQWQFPEELVEVARGCEEWNRCPGTRADLCDLVLVATLHSYIGKRRRQPPPRMDQVPAYQKLALGKLTPEMTLQVLVEAREQIAQARALMAA